MQATIGDLRIGYESHGSGPPLLLLHAFPLSRAMYADQNQGLSKFCRVVTFDVPGIGRSERAPLSINAMADWAVGLMDSLQIREAVVGGVSMGGYAALAFARRHPERLRGLLLANTRAAADSDEARQGRRDMAQVAINEGAAGVAERMLPKVLGATALKGNRALVDRVRKMIESTPPTIIEDLLMALAGRDDATAVLDKIRVPTLVISGEEDVLTPAKEMREWSARIPNHIYAEIVGAGHLANMESPARFNEIVKGYFERLENGR